MSKLIGQILGQYHIIEQIGQGGMATVYKAYQASLERYIALKILLPSYAQQPNFNQRFQREAKVIATLNHPNILPAYDFGQIDAYSFIVMRYIENARTLKDVMATPLTFEQIINLLTQIATALDYAHTAGIIHRDVKPSNILMDGDWALLSDFGLAKMVNNSIHLTNTGVGLGTPAYMSPEQGQGVPVAHYTDIYALGIILFEMLTGQIPHQADTPFGILLKRITDPLPSPRLFNPNIPEVIEHVVLKALAQNPTDRFETATQLTDTLKETAYQAGIKLEHSFIDPSQANTQTVLQSSSLEIVKNKVTAEPIRSTLLSTNKLNNPQQRNRHLMLKLVKDFWIKGVLENSLHGANLIQLGMADYSGAIERPWDAVLQMPNLPSLTIPPGTNIGEVFKTMGETLLILGEPGSGKTTMLLELARETIAQAKQDPTQAIPVVFNLSSWNDKGQTLDFWLVDELNNKYNIPRDIAQSWIDNDALLLLLDGLDEVSLTQREACVQAINTFRQTHLVPMVVCSRIADYEALSVQLKLQNAILLQPLNPEQIQAYLDKVGPALATLKQMLQNDPNLQKLAQSPLLLSVMAMAYRGKSFAELPLGDSLEARHKHLFETYIHQMFKRRGANLPYSVEQTLQWLTYLAKKMNQQAQTVFLIEQLQPSWLSTITERFSYAFISRLIAPLIFGLVFYFFFYNRQDIAATGIAGLTWLFSGIGIAVLDFYRLEQTKISNETITRSPNYFLKSMLNAFIMSIASIVFSIILYSLVFGIGFNANQADFPILIALFISVTLTMSFFLFAFLFIAFLRSSKRSITNDISTVEALSYSRQNMFKNSSLGIKVGGLAALLIALTIDLFIGVILGGLIAMMIIFVSGMFGGLTSKITEHKISPNQGMRLSLKNALTIGLLIFTVPCMLPVLGITIIYPLEGSRSIFEMLVIAISISLLTSLWYGGFDIIQHYTLRFILWWQGALPWNLTRFLEYAVERIFLRKVGGSYIFVHRLLLDYFANLDEKPSN